MKGAVAIRDGSSQTTTPAATRRVPSMFASFQNEVNKLFEDFGFGWDKFRVSQTDDMIARIDVKDAGKEVVITAELPGVAKEDMQLTLTPHYLSLMGEKKEEKGEHEEGYFHMERSYGFFRRVIPLPCAVEKDAADAVFENGVLKVTLPKTKEAMGEERKIKIRTI